MIYNDLKQLLRLYNLFIRRKVLKTGILKTQEIRLLVYFLIILFFGFLSYIWYHIFGGLNAKENFYFIIHLSAANNLITTVLIFMCLKMVFYRTKSFLKFTFNLPITSRIRMLSLISYELLLFFVVGMICLLPFTISVLLQTGFRFIIEIMNLIFTFFMIVNIVNVLYYFLDYFLTKVLKNSYMRLMLIITIVFSLSYYLSVDWQLKILHDYPNFPQTIIPVLFYYQITNLSHFLISCVCFGLINLIVLFLLFKIPKNIHTSYNKYSNMNIRKMNVFKAYIAASIKLQDSIITYLFCSIIYVLFLFFDFPNGIFIFLLLSVNGVFLLPNTYHLRCILKLTGNYSVWKDYVYLVSSQVVLNIFVMIPYFIIDYFVYHNYMNLGLTMIMQLVSAMYMVMTSILFPSKEENPFSVLLGMSIAFIVLILSYLLIILFKIMWLQFILSMIMLVGVVIISILGLQKLKMKEVL